MKKLVLMFVAVAAISFASCGNKTQATEDNTDSVANVDSASNDSLQNDSLQNDSVKNDSVK